MKTPVTGCDGYPGKTRPKNPLNLQLPTMKGWHFGQSIRHEINV
jgi:hypothetical protein